MCIKILICRVSTSFVDLKTVVNVSHRHAHRNAQALLPQFLTAYSGKILSLKCDFQIDVFLQILMASLFL